MRVRVALSALEVAFARSLDERRPAEAVLGILIGACRQGSLDCVEVATLCRLEEVITCVSNYYFVRDRTASYGYR